ncbi:hypothetical protein AB0L65_07540 [Nonomuraea sp. NPDC052116]|uniref:hypothetical protein n=1 Tax=Nonomuraea sp. NPDC052116 TaxID=3155665 RepID=UPI00341A5D04
MMEVLGTIGSLAVVLLLIVLAVLAISVVALVVLGCLAGSMVTDWRGLWLPARRRPFQGTRTPARSADPRASPRGSAHAPLSDGAGRLTWP